MINVAFFSNHFARKTGTGVTRYAQSLIHAFSALNDWCNVIPVATWSNRDQADLKTFQQETGLRLLPTGRWLSPLLWWTIGVPKIEQLLNFPVDILHVNDMNYVVSTSKPYVVTVHDLGALAHPEFFNNNSSGFTQRGLQYAIRKAGAMICVSRATADSLAEYVRARYSIDLSDRIFVAHEGVADAFLQPADPSALSALNAPIDPLTVSYILAVGKISPRKNLESVIRALGKLKDEIPHHLITVGGDGWDFENVKTLASASGLSDRIHFLSHVDDAMLNALYTHAALFIYPSLFEGFGLPVLEAMSAGCPVITSNVSSLPEVAGDAALLIDPRNVDEIASAMEAVCKDSALAETLRSKGKLRAAQFSWKKCAEETAQVYHSLIS
jgi:glycosyltransferase involved in cell wall biosynthesis